MASKRANPGRVAAARALIAVDKGAHVEDELAKRAPDAPRDRALAWYLALGVLQRRATVDASLRPFLREPIGGLDPEVRAVLRIGAFEKLFARTPPHAAVSQAVEVAKKIGARRASGLVNAIVRKVKDPEDLSRADSLDHPAWLVARWDELFGEAATSAWCERNNQAAPRYIVCKGAEPPRFPHQTTDVTGVYAVGGDVSTRPDELPGFAEGEFWIQDIAAVRVADLVGAKPGMTVLDAAAAPGGKSFRLASHGAQVTAVDISDTRLDRTRQSAARLDLPVQVHVHDWLTGKSDDLGLFDAVLVDAPCTGLGTLRRHPEIRWRRQMVDTLRMPDTQLPILSSAAAHVASGGVLVYAVCSPEPREGEGVVAAFLADNPGFRLDSELRTYPSDADEDAHYAARMVRDEAAP